MHDALVSVAGSLRKVGETLVAQQRSVIFIRIASNNEVGFIVKPTITLTAKSEFVLVPLRCERHNFSTCGFMFFVDTWENTMCGLSPVVCSSSRHFVRSVVSESGSYHEDRSKKSISIFSK